MTRHDVVYGLTRLSAQAASPARLLQLVRTHGTIESELHYRRDVTLREDATRMTRHAFARVVATLNNLVLALLDRAGWSHLPQARRCYAAHPDRA